MPNKLPQWQDAFLERNQLPHTYLGYAQKWFTPLAERLLVHQDSAKRPILVAVNGCQGSGKTTVCDYLRSLLVSDHGRRVVSLSLDDFYLSRGERQELAGTVHPLLATRGVPGTHDIALLNRTLDQLLEPTRCEATVAIPRFDKSLDDRAPAVDWDYLDGAVDLVLLEGWCLGARAQCRDALLHPLNDLERDEDPQGQWRAFANNALAHDFEPLYLRVDQWVMLRAPSFECVNRWRMEQERKLAAVSGTTSSTQIMDAAQVARFVQHFQRLTQECLANLPSRVDYLYQMDEQRGITGVIQHPVESR